MRTSVCVHWLLVLHTLFQTKCVCTCGGLGPLLYLCTLFHVLFFGGWINLWGLMTVYLPWKNTEVFCIVPDSLSPQCGPTGWNPRFQRQTDKKCQEETWAFKGQATGKGLWEGFHCNGSSLSGLAASTPGTPEEENQALLSIWMLTPLLQGRQCCHGGENQINNEAVRSPCVRGRIRNNFNVKVQSFRGQATSWCWEIKTAIESIIWISLTSAMIMGAVVSHTLIRIWNNDL